MYLKTLHALAQALSLAPENTPDVPINGFCVDSRQVEKGTVFFALKGAKQDGHAFLHEVEAKGAVAAVVDSTCSFTGSLPLLRVPNVLLALQSLARVLIKQMRVPVVALTGSLGKTSTKDFLTALLTQKYRVFSTPGNQNSQIGLPLALLNGVEGDEEVFVIEMGMTEKGHIAQLVSIAPPTLALVTCVELVHACNFASLEEIAQAKAEILSHPDTRLAIINSSLRSFSCFTPRSAFSTTTFSIEEANADYFLEETATHLVVYEKGHGQKLPSLQIPARHNRQNVLAAIVAARALQLSWEEIAAGIPTLTLPDRRLQMVYKEKILFINDSYNAAVPSTKAAIDLLPAPQPGKKKVAVLGGMVELGQFSVACHQEILDYAAARVEKIFCFGEEWLQLTEILQTYQGKVTLFPSHASLLTSLRAFVRPGDVVLIKGSRLKRMWEILEAF